MRCAPCHDGDHLECTHSLHDACDCLVCIAARIGENALGEHPVRPQDRDLWETIERDE